MNSIVVYRNPLEQWMWESDGWLYLFILFTIIYFALNGKRWWLTLFCKHPTVWEDSQCNAHCRACGKNLGFIGKWRDRKV